SAAIICTDAGPGNTLIDTLCKKYFNVAFDNNGEIARSGKPDKSLLGELLSHAFFAQDFPKTTGPELFNIQFFEEAIAKTASIISNQDLISTATVFTVEAISKAIKNVL